MTDHPIPPDGATDAFDLTSDAVGDEFRIFATECGPDPETTLLVTDADGLFGLAVDTVRLMQVPALVPPMLVVGIGYPGASSITDTVEIRARDLTPTRAHTAVFDRSGGAENFARFIQTELHPWLATRFPRAVGDRTYFGHSLGGLFGASLMLTQPEMFTRYVLSSPSLWWGREVIFELERSRFEAGHDLHTAAFLGIGGLETDAGRRAEAANLPVGHWAKPPEAHLDMVADLRRFANQLRSRSYPGLDLQLLELAGEFHATVPGITLTRALRYFWSG